MPIAERTRIDSIDMIGMVHVVYNSEMRIFLKFYKFYSSIIALSDGAIYDDPIDMENDDLLVDPSPSSDCIPGAAMFFCMPYSTLSRTFHFPVSGSFSRKFKKR